MNTAFVSVITVWVMVLLALPAGASRIDPFGCQYMTNQTTCSDVATCDWTGGTCVTVCQWQQQLSGVCASSWCMWNPEYTVCEPACNTLSHNYDLCVTTPQCQWNDVTRLCTFDCGAVANHSACAALPACEWSSSARACRTSCYFRYSTQRLCNADPECMWNLPAGDCQPSCPAYNGNNVLCFGSSACTYNSNVMQCSLACSSVASETSCATQYGCRWSQSNSTCVPLCVFAYYNPIDCNGDPHCMWDATIQACATQCQYIVTASSCIAETQCYWNGTACSRTCAAITDSTTCARNLDCIWSDPDLTCQPTCNGRLSTACMLGPEPLCHLDVADQCEASCNGLYLSAPTCNTDTRCNWNDTTSSCEASCQALFTAGQCGSITGCSWVPTKGICMTTCSTQTNSTACSQLLECLWSTTLQICRIACDMLTDASVCNRDTQCSWDIVDTQCHASCAGRYGTQGSCLRDARCAWNSVHGVCQENCTFVGDPVRCNETSSCAWNTPTSKCVSTVNSIQIDSVQYAAQLNNSDLRPGLVIALQTDLSNAYNAQVQIVDTRISIAAALTTVPFLAPIEAPPQVIANSVGIKDGSWLKQSIKAFVANGGTQSLTVTAYIPAGTTPSTESPSSSMALHTVVLIAGCSAAALLVVSACAVWGWRHNPYAVARAPVQTTERFTNDEYDRLKAINERVITHEEAIMLKQRWDATHGSAGANEGMNQWPVVARCEMPKNQQRKPAQRQVWDDMCTSLFPSVFEHLTQQRIAVDEQGFIRTPARNAVEVMRYTLALRLHAQGKGNIEFVMSGLARIVLVDDARRLLSVSTNIVDSTVDVFPAAREAFERSGWCSEAGSHETRKLVFGRLRPSESFIVVATDPLPDSTPVLIGFPRDCTCAVVESAIHLMLRLATAILESRRDFSDEKLRVHRLEDTWRLNATPDVLAAIAVLSPRFWMIDQDILCCHCSVGIPIHPVVPFVHTIRTAMDVNVPIPSRNRSPSTHPNTTPSIDMSAGSSISEELETNLLLRRE